MEVTSYAFYQNVDLNVVIKPIAQIRVNVHGIPNLAPMHPLAEGANCQPYYYKAFFVFSFSFCSNLTFISLISFNSSIIKRNLLLISNSRVQY